MSGWFARLESMASWQCSRVNGTLWGLQLCTLCLTPGIHAFLSPLSSVKLQWHKVIPERVAGGKVLVPELYSQEFWHRGLASYRILTPNLYKAVLGLAVMGRNTCCSSPTPTNAPSLLLPFLIPQQEEMGCRALVVGDGAAGNLVHQAELCVERRTGEQD